MCGIFGLIHQFNDDVAIEMASSMQNSILHRGPDHSGVYSERGVVIGINRLAILDLSSGNQPIFNDDKSLVIVYNGEVYNHLEIRSELERKGHIFKTHCDTETILRAFMEWGEDSVIRLNGMFAFAIWDVRRRVLFIARDRLGIKPLYIAKLNRGYGFASEPKALLHLLPNGVSLDYNAISRYFSLGYVPYTDCAFSGIEKFPPAHYGYISLDNLEKKCYFKHHYGMASKTDIESASNRVIELIEQSVKSELQSDVPVGIFLSGGLDSSAVAVFAKKHSTQNPKSFALRFTEATHDESGDARIVANHLGLDHHEFTFDKQTLYDSLFKVADILDEPFGDSTVLPLLTLSQYTRNYVKVVLTGWGGDEIFAGYPTYKAHLYAALYRRLPNILGYSLIPSIVNRLPVSDKYMSFDFKAKRFIKGMDVLPELQHFIWMGYFDNIEKERLFMPELHEFISVTYDAVSSVIDELTEHELVNRIMRLDGAFFLEGNGLFQADRMTMAASIEARVPLLNIKLIDYVNSLPASLKMKGGVQKYLLKKALKPYLPERIINKPKKGFGPPSSSWIRNVFSDVYKELFNEAIVTTHGIFQYKEIARLLNEHNSMKYDHGRKLWAILSFQLWYNRFILGYDKSCVNKNNLV